MSNYEMCSDNHFEIIKELKKYIIEATNIETSPKEMEVLDDICFRLWQLGLTLETKNELESLKKENQELAETLELYNEKFAGHERVKADLIKENQELKRKYESHDFLYQNEISKNGTLAGKIFEKDLKIQKLENAIKIIMKWRRDQVYDLIQNLEHQNINGFETLKEVIEDVKDYR